jgi:hypothetical protein
MLPVPSTVSIQGRIAYNVIVTVSTVDSKLTIFMRTWYRWFTNRLELRLTVSLQQNTWLQY